MARTSWASNLTPGQVAYIKAAIGHEGKRGKANKGYWIRTQGLTLPRPKKVELVYRTSDGREVWATDITDL
jgi:hypothetical protein